VKCLEQLAGFCGADRTACVARELTKLHEELCRDSLANLAVYFGKKPVKGEIVIVVAGS
jgi:16S rRNA (cytidine1402-2'-O)-methyltransferase